MKKWFIICILVVLLGMTSIVGCGKKEVKYTPETDWKEYVDVQDMKLVYSAKEDYQDKTVLNWVLPAGACEDNNSSVYREFNRLLDEKGYSFVVDFYVLNCDGEDYYRYIRSMKQAGAEVDIFYTGFDYFGGLYSLCIEENLCAPWNDYLSTAEGKKLYESKDEKIWKALSVSDVIYGIVGNANAPVSELYSYYFNNRILEQYGWNAEELVGDSKKLTEAVKTVFEKESEITACGLINTENIFVFSDYVNLIQPISYSVRENKYVNLLMTSEGKEWLNLYVSNAVKILDESAVNNTDSYFLLVEQQWDLQVPDANKDGVTIVNSKAYGLTYEGGVNCVAAWSKNTDAAFSFLNVIHTDTEITKVLAYGLEGENYEEDEEGIHVIEPYSVFGDMMLSNWGIFRQKYSEEQLQNVLFDSPFLSRRFSVLDCYREMVKAEEICLSSIPTIADKKEWGKENFSEKYNSLKSEFETAGGNYLLDYLNKEKN